MTHVLVHVLEFDDGGADAQLFGRGTRAECEHTRTLVPVVAYNGTRKVTAIWWAIVTAAEWQTALDEERAMEVAGA